MKTRLITMMMAAIALMMSTPAMAQSHKDKKAAKKADWEYEQKIKELKRQRTLDSLANLQNETFVEIPCYEASRSDADYYRELGTGSDLMKENARKMAVQNAQSMLKERLAHTVKGLATDYSKMVSKSGKNAEIAGIIEGECTSVIDAELRDADNICEKWSQDRNGRWNCYYVIQIDRRKLADEMAQAISDNDELKIEFDRDQFRKYADEYLKKQQDFQNGRQ